MESKLKVTFNDIRRFIEWSFFIEEGDIHAQSGTSSIDQMERELANRLLAIYRQSKKQKKDNIFHFMTYNDCEITQHWFQKLPEGLLDQADADLHTMLSIFIANPL